MDTDEEKEGLSTEGAPLKANSSQRHWLPFIVLWGLSPAIVFVISGFFVDTRHIHPESPEYPHEQVDAMLKAALFLSFTWSVWLVLRVTSNIGVRLVGVIPVTFVVFWVNAFIGAAGCVISDAVVGR